jgi:hypothetical protein
MFFKKRPCLSVEQFSELCQSGQRKLKTIIYFSTHIKSLTFRFPLIVSALYRNIFSLIQEMYEYSVQLGLENADENYIKYTLNKLYKK